MTAFFDNSIFFDTIKEQDQSLYTNNDNVLYRVKEEEVEETTDFFISKSPYSLCKDQDMWDYVLSQLKQEIFNSTSASYSIPETYVIKKYEQVLPQQVLKSLQSSNSFNSSDDLYASSDMLNYRKSRSENLLIRMIQCSNLDIGEVSLMRLAKGIFIHQKFESSIPHPSPTLSTIQECSYASQYMDTQVEAPVNTFHHHNMYQMMNNELTKQCYDMFIPYTYTFGARYTNPYGDRHDLVIRGRLPLWCQTLFLSNCIKQPTPIKPNEPRLGLFPFAPHIPVTFKHLDPDNNESGIAPELTVIYERITMDHLDPFDLPGIYDNAVSEGPDKKSEILRNILVCDLPDDLAKVIEDLSFIWAASQGLDI